MSAHETAHPVIKAVVWMMGALVSFMVMAVAVRELSATMHAFEILFIRSAIGLAILIAILSIKGWGPVRTQRLSGHALRNVLHFIGQVLWIFGIKLLPLATVFAIEFTTPIWAAFFSVLFLGERMNRGRWVALVLGFTGILIILKPGLAGLDPDILIMIFCALFFGMTMTVTKWLTRTEQALTIVFYMTLMQAGFGLVTSTFVWTPVTVEQWPWLILAGITGLTAHYSMVSAFGYADATLVAPMDFLRLPLIALVGYFVYAEALDMATLVGAVLIFSGNYYSIRHESRGIRRHGAPSPPDNGLR